MTSAELDTRSAQLMTHIAQSLPQDDDLYLNIAAKMACMLVAAEEVHGEQKHEIATLRAKLQLALERN